MKEFLGLKAPLWLVIVVYLMAMFYTQMEHSERQQQTRDLDRRVFQLELRR